MKVTLVFLSFVVLGDPALAQSGVSNQRDMNGNLVRNGGAASGGVNQSTPNNGAIRNAPIQTRTNPASPHAEAPRRKLREANRFVYSVRQRERATGAYVLPLLIPNSEPNLL